MIKKFVLLSALIALATTSVSTQGAPAATSNDRSAIVNADVAHHRTIAPQRTKVTNVATYEGYALVAWEDENSGGQDVLKFRDGAWRFIGGGGGMPEARSLVTLYGVPSHVAQVLTARMKSHFSHP